METPIEQTLSKATMQFGLRMWDYLILVAVATIGSFFISKFWLLLVLAALAITFRYINKAKGRYFWSSRYLSAISPRSLHLRQTKKLPALFDPAPRKE